MNGILIAGTAFDIPTKDDLTKWNYREWKEDRTAYREFWLERYDAEGSGKSRTCGCLLLRNRTAATLDGKRLKGSDFENSLKVFDIIDELRK